MVLLQACPSCVDREPGQEKDLDQRAVDGEVAEHVDPEVRDVENSITVLERTIADPQLARGPALDNSLRRQLVNRREQLSDLTLRNRSSEPVSVIIHTSTPSATPEASFRADQTFFGAGEDLRISPRAPAPEPPGLAPPPPPPPPPAPATLPFPIHLDPHPPPAAVRPLGPRTIPIVITPSPSLADQDKENIEPRFGFTMTNDGEMNEAARAKFAEMKRVNARLRTLQVTYDPSNYSVEILRANKKEWIDTVVEAFQAYMTLLIDWGAEHDNDDEDESSSERSPSKQEVDKLHKDLGAEMVAYITRFNEKILQATPTVAEPGSAPPSSHVTSAPPSLVPGSTATTGPEAIRKAGIEADIEHDRISSAVKTLTSELRKVALWEDAESHVIEVAMSKISGWKTKMDKIQENLYSLKRIVQTHNLDPVRLSAQESAVQLLHSELGEAVDIIEHENEERCLYALNKSAKGDIKYPKFAGGKEQDYLKFEADMLDALKHNRVPKTKLVEKLRENLSGDPLDIIPETMTDLNKALGLLRPMYGNSSRLVKAKREKLKAMGAMPKPESKAKIHVKTRMEWLLGLELLLQELFVLASHDVDCNNEVFNNTTLRWVKAMFPSNIHNKMVLHNGTAQEKLESILTDVIEMRERDERVLQDVDGEDDDATPKTGRGGRGAAAARRWGRGGGGAGAGGQQCHLTKRFNTPTRFEQCRICNYLQTEGDCRNLFEDHYSNQPFGCPRFAEMTCTQRKKYAMLAKICIFCLDGDYIYKKGTAHPNCPAMNGNKFFTCKSSGCKEHYLVCDKHSSQNQEMIDKNKKFWGDRHKVFSNVSIISPAPNLLDVSHSTASGHGLIGSVSAGAPGPGLEPVTPSPSVPSPMSSNSNIICNRALTEATKTLRSLAKGARVREVPKGGPLFLFSTIPGKTRPLTVFYDSGCSHLLIKEGVPHNELDAVKIRDGPVDINAAGDVTVRLKDEWACLISMADGSKQIVIGTCCDKITSTFPQINVKKAFEEIKDNTHGQKKEVVSKLRVPDVCGGDPDLLLGIFYQNCHPEVVHSLPNGLFIARLKLSSVGNFNACIGGPHHSFALLATQVGDAARLMSFFTQQINNFKTFGAPKLPAPLVTNEDIEFAQRMNAAEMAEIVPGLQADGRIHVLCADCGPEAAVRMSAAEILDQIEDNVEATEMRVLRAEFDGTEAQVHDLKLLMKLQELGISLEYRCPRCRNCSDCRNAPDTERVSCREEREDEAIRQSVMIDYENKKITARMPLRGDEAQYLSNNREVAMKVLQSQCLKVKNDPETREIVVKAFNKLLDNKYAVRFDELSADQQRMIEDKEVSYYLPWRVVHKASSVSTPCRPVFDASSNTPLLADGRGGRNLNDLTMKGKITSLDYLNMILRFITGPAAFHGDLKGFYTSIGLVEDQWNLQRVLWRDNLDPDAKLEELVIVTLIFGVRAVSALSERAVLDIADQITQDFPRLAELLHKSRFVDDLADSMNNNDDIKKLIESADNLFASVGLTCKGWTLSHLPPPKEVSSDGNGVEIGGMIWWSQLDSLMVKIPQLFFAKKSRGRIAAGTQIFDGTFEDLNKFVPDKLTRRMVVSKFSSLYDPLGKLCPVTAAMKAHMRRAVMETTGWDGVLTKETRLLWVTNFWRLHNLRGLQFTRARIPSDAADTKLQLIVAVDAAKELKISGVWARFLRTDGSYSSQLVIGRSLLCREESSIPREELEAISMGSNLLWVVRKALQNWMDEEDYIILSDSVIALCWLTAENKRLSLWHRNRVNQVKFNSDISKLYHVTTSQNPADTGSRPEKTQLNLVGPGSVWEVGMPWMTRSVEAAIDEGILRPASSLRTVDKDESEYEKGFILDEWAGRAPEILVHGHAVTEARVDKMTERAEFSNYMFMPTKYDFRKTVIITSLVFKFIRLCKYKIKRKVDTSFRMFPATYCSAWVNICWGTETSAAAPDNVPGSVVRFDNEDIARSLQYWFMTATKEVVKFVKPETVARVGVMKNEVLYCRSRILDGQRIINTGEFNVDSLDAGIGLHLMTPLVERYSPIAMSIGRFIHNIAGNHAGYETCLRLSLNYCHILSGGSLFRQIGDECSKCKVLRKKYIDCLMGPVSDHQLTIAPAFHTAYLDILGPFVVYVPGFERTTRARKSMDVFNYILTFVCPVTKITNLQVIEAKNCEAVLEGFIRLGCEQGFPACVVLDQETSFMKTVRDAEVNLTNLSMRAFREFGIRFEVVPVGGHNYNGICERKIKTVQECFEKIGLKNIRMHSTGLQTFCKLVENQLNNTPLGFSYGRDHDTTPILKIVTPNLMKIGRLNSRSLSGPLRFPKGPKEYLKKVEQTYDSFFKLWNTSCLPKLIPQPKWFRDGPELKPEDVVMFRKKENDLSSEWTVGQVESVTRSRDGVVRRAEIRYHNPGDVTDPDTRLLLTPPKFTDRAVRTLVRLFSLDDAYFIEDMAAVEQKLLRDTQGLINFEDRRVVQTVDGRYEMVGSNFAEDKTCECCCEGHCSMEHVPYANNGAQVSAHAVRPAVTLPEANLRLDPAGEEYDDYLLPLENGDELHRILTAVETKFELLQ